jgi:transcriptional regulator with XRE-family HTH domain
MTQGERVRKVRKEVGLTLEKFGEKLGVKKNAISQIENGRNSLSEHMTKSICREYGVDYIWLTTGEGEMFVDSDQEFFDKIDRIMADEDETRRNLIKSLLYAPDEDIEAVSRLVKHFAELEKAQKKEKEES